MTLPITTLLTSFLALWLLVLSANVIRYRGVSKVSLGDGGDEPLTRRIRAQANLTEYAPVIIAMVGLAEYQGGNTYVVGLFALLFALARLTHGYALSFSAHSPKGRLFGTAGTFVILALLALHNLLLFVI